MLQIIVGLKFHGKSIQLYMLYSYVHVYYINQKNSQVHYEALNSVLNTIQSL